MLEDLVRDSVLPEASLAHRAALAHLALDVEVLQEDRLASHRADPLLVSEVHHLSAAHHRVSLRVDEVDHLVSVDKMGKRSLRTSNEKSVGLGCTTWLEIIDRGKLEQLRSTKRLYQCTASQSLRRVKAACFGVLVARQWCEWRRSFAIFWRRTMPRRMHWRSNVERYQIRNVQVPCHDICGRRPSRNEKLSVQSFAQS